MIQFFKKVKSNYSIFFNTQNSKILKNYFTSFLNLFLRVSLSLIAIPILSNTPDILAIYSICISLGFFFKYSDFGFIAAGRKYAAEHVISSNFNLQLRFLGNSYSFTFIVSLFLSVTLFIISFYPEIIISELELNKEYKFIASVLIKALSISNIFQVFTNYISTFFEVNLKKYYCDIISIFSAIVSFFLFFVIDKTNQNWILIYFISLKIMDLIALIGLLFMSKKVFKIKPIKLFQNFRIRKKLLKKGLKLSLASIIVSISAFLFHELDNLFLAKNMDLSLISYFSIAVLGPYVLKTIFSLLYSPFSSIFNYIKNDKQLFKDYFNKIIIFFFPIIFTGIIIVSFFSREIIFSYVGFEYNNSIALFIYLCLSLSFSFIIFPTSIYLFSMEFNKRIIFSGLIPTILFWALNFYHIFFNDNITLEVFCMNKMFSNLSILPLYINYLVKDNFIDLNLLKKLLKSFFFSVILFSLVYIPYNFLMTIDKSILSLISNVLLIACLIISIKIMDLFVNRNQINIKNIFIKKS